MARIWWLSWEKICLQCRRPGFDPWVRKKKEMQKEMATHSSVLAWKNKNPMNRGAWRATVHGVTGVGHDLATRPLPHLLPRYNFCNKNCCDHPNIVDTDIFLQRKLSLTLWSQNLCLRHTYKWPHVQAWCHTSHHSSRSWAVGHRDSDRAALPHSGTQGSICTPPLHSRDWPNTQKIHCMLEICKGWLDHLKCQTNQRKRPFHFNVWQNWLQIKKK